MCVYVHTKYIEWTLEYIEWNLTDVIIASCISDILLHNIKFFLNIQQKGKGSSGFRLPWVTADVIGSDAKKLQSRNLDQYWLTIRLVTTNDILLGISNNMPQNAFFYSTVFPFSMLIIEFPLNFFLGPRTNKWTWFMENNFQWWWCSWTTGEIDL